MHTKWNKPHDFLKRLIPCLVLAGVTGLLGFMAYETNNRAQAVSTTTYEVGELEVLDSTDDPETENLTEIAKTEETETSMAATSPLVISQTLADEISTPLLDEIMEMLYRNPDYLPDLSLHVFTWDSLQTELTTMVGDYSGNWSIYIKDLSSGNVISINDRPQESASLIKLFVMGAVLEQINDGTLESSDSINTLLNKMITLSDNTATNDLVKYLSPERDHTEGMAVVNDFALRHGFTNTKHVNGLNDSRLQPNKDEFNHTSTKDCGELLSTIYEGKLISHLASRKMENLLLAQEVTYKIPTALPSNAISANKTGETDDSENDSAIIYSKGGDFILCIMSEKWENKNQAVDRIREITKLTYKYFNPEESEQ